MRLSGSERDRIARYFDDHARDFDSIYDDRDKSKLRVLRDKLSRRTVVRRLDFVLTEAARLKPATVLDVGCGAGRFAVPLAERGARVVGLDVAEEMVALAKRRAAEAGVGARCEFLAEDFLSWSPGERFDLSLAVGVFDYLAEAEPLLEKMASETKGTLVASFPRRWHPLVPLRVARLRAAGLPVHFFDRARVSELGGLFLSTFEVVGLGRDFLLSGRAS
jgi:2-polyprenyl-3-methyl-5-hydroxy-6-metoxy-1,4-benzoquinol methylase